MTLSLRLTIGKAEPLLRGQDHFWRCIRAVGLNGATFTGSAVRAMTDEPHVATVTTYLRRLTSAGYLERLDEKAVNAATSRPEHVYRLLRDQEQPPALSPDGTPARRQVSVQQAMWNVVRGPLARRGFTFNDLVAWGSTDEAPVSAQTAKSFIGALNQGGYLQELEASRGNYPALWRLRPSMNTGPKPPMILTAKLVWDQNRGRVAGPAIAEEVEP